MSRIEIGPTRPVGAIDVRTPRADSTPGHDAPRVEHGTPAERAAFDPGVQPVDAERVNLIRKAIESGTYPVVPARIADAVIAAGMLLRAPK